MRATVIEADMSHISGGQLVAIEAIWALKEAGYDVTLVTGDFNEDFIKILGGLPRGTRVLVVLRQLQKMRFYKNYLLAALGEFMKADVVLNVYSNELIIPSRFTYHFVFFPFRISDKVGRKALQSLYYMPGWLNEKLIDTLYIRKRRRYIANSLFTGWAMKVRWGVAPYKVLYPPTILRFSGFCESKKENCIVSIGRFSPDKRQHEQLLIARLLKDLGVDFNMKIIGALFKKSSVSVRYFNKLQKMVKKLGLENVVELHVDVDQHELTEALAKSKVLLHTYRVKLRDIGWIGEHFGISIVEGMNAGAIPVVPAIPSGAWWDILEKGRYGFGFTSYKDAARKIVKILQDDELYVKLARRVHERSLMFSSERFRRGIIELVKDIASSGNSNLWE